MSKGARAAAIGAVAGAAIAVWMALSSRPAVEEIPLFELTNWDGRTVSNQTLRGKTAILAFSYAKCVSGCPMLTHMLKFLDESIGSPKEMVYLHISVNPAADTPEELLQHFEKHGIDPKQDPRWMFLRGDERRVAGVLKDFGIEVKRVPTEGGENIEHTIKVHVIDPNGKSVAVFDTYFWDSDEMLKALRAAAAPV